jgi:hypothetical protein
MPFHESVLNLISETKPTDKEGLRRLATFLTQTAIPANHDAISEAWMEKARAHGEQEQREKDPLPNEFLEQRWFEEVNISILGQKPA